MGLLPTPKSKRLASAAHRNAPKQERKVAARVGGTTTPGSGSKELKGDVRLKSVARIECKSTIHDSFSITLDMLRKIQDAACQAGEIPAIHVEFVTKDGTRRAAVCVVPEYVLDELCK